VTSRRKILSIEIDVASEKMAIGETGEMANDDREIATAVFSEKDDADEYPQWRNQPAESALVTA